VVGAVGGVGALLLALCAAYMLQRSVAHVLGLQPADAPSYGAVTSILITDIQVRTGWL
jgi:hypothetical protein